MGRSFRNREAHSLESHTRIGLPPQPADMKRDETERNEANQKRFN